ncbi:2',3'-cyclic-nucleotide 2'-phosphodiesterase / 3'-nucleotidase [Marinilactibacillus piezotolerans]|uniref:2',3'-cyclic-nucleotide 2'-phosphodiesterase / 3'-nucleotidase n=1 Tax=Marinilactibacillus piezotolerans TaxID=258723 RepID=A0A1I4ANH8_9LACT|nr:bifunctional UDP-sugar hydrolase/5'-nucleotidase [Marinilactibacillus piezotolerans]SFK57289.1 2',3'-cyclic-nucleotide 2'-phosphodiesterase / 3'-nucleotidase [Marinilactibacillus piezotolerans]
MKLTIFETSDVHGYLFPTNYQERGLNLGFGLFKLAYALKKEMESIKGPTILIENGDFIQGSPLSFFVLKEKGQANSLIDALNDLPYDAGVIGNHEFNYGLDYLNSAVNSARYPVLSANVLNEQGKPAFGEPYILLEKEGVNIAILGLTTQYIPHWEHPGNYAGLFFQSALETAKVYVPKLKELADVVIVSYHGGFEKDIDTGEETEIQTGENEGYKLLTEVEGIDVLLTGHQHRELAQMKNGIPTVMPGHKGSYLGKVTLDLQQENKNWIIKAAQPELIQISEKTPVEFNLADKYEKLNQEVEDWLDQPIGKVTGDMTIKNVEQARIIEHPYIEFIQKVQMYYTDCDISGTALFNNESSGFNPQVTMRDVVTNYIFPNTLAVLKVTGAELKAAIEQSAEYFVLNDQGEIDVNPDFIEPKPQMYNYDMYEGVEYTINVSKPFGERVIEFNYKGKPVQSDDILEVVINQYRAVGGGDYTMFDASKIIREVTIPMNELIGNYFKEFGTVKATVNHNFKVVK